MPSNQPRVAAYLFTGFLESGKTKFIQETLGDKSFNSGEKTMILMCEEGEEEYDTSLAYMKNVSVRAIDEAGELTAEKLSSLAKECGAVRVMIEYNGMWQLSQLFQNLPEDWGIYQEIFFVDSSTFLSYNSNMRSLVVDKLNTCDLVAFNRFDPDKMDKMEFHKIVRGTSRRTDIVYESTDGTMDYDDIQDPLPFDINAPVIEIADSDYALWYRDIMEEPEKYNGKTVNFKGVVAVDGTFPKNTFAVGRHVMTCCVDDIRYCCVIAEWDKTAMLSQRQWVKVTGGISIKKHKLYRGKGPVLTIKEVVMTGAPEQDVATFY